MGNRLCAIHFFICVYWFAFPDSKVHGANMGPTWGRQDPGGPHVGPMNFAIWFGFHGFHRVAQFIKIVQISLTLYISLWMDDTTLVVYTSHISLWKIFSQLTPVISNKLKHICMWYLASLMGWGYSTNFFHHEFHPFMLNLPTILPVLSHPYLTGISTAQQHWHLSNMNVIPTFKR